MLLAVFSDSHGRIGPMTAAVETYRPDRVLFLGDGVRDAEAVRRAFPDIPFTILSGNCDHVSGYDDRAILKLGLYGHTHRPLWQELRGVQLLNPGSIGSREKPTFALVRLENGKADCRILDAPAPEKEAKA